MPYVSPNSPPTIRRGQISAAPTSANLEFRHISETLRARKLKFYVRLDRVTLLEYGFFPLWGAGGAGGRLGGLKLQCRAIATFSSYYYYGDHDDDNNN